VASVIWPWSALRALRRDVRAARLSCSAEAKRANRLAARIRLLDARVARLRGQVARDQAYIDVLESRLGPDEIEQARVEIRS
jgi:hypothetical protein